jgi:hypothetical protein
MKIVPQDEVLSSVFKHIEISEVMMAELKNGISYVWRNIDGELEIAKTNNCGGVRVDSIFVPLFEEPSLSRLNELACDLLVVAGEEKTELSNPTHKIMLDYAVVQIGDYDEDNFLYVTNVTDNTVGLAILDNTQISACPRDLVFNGQTWDAKEEKL